MRPSRDTLGHRGEAEAASYLRSIGYRIVATRERILRGDIDLVALDGRTVVFVEVRSRSSTAHGHPPETCPDGAPQLRRRARTTKRGVWLPAPSWPLGGS